MGWPHHPYNNIPKKKGKMILVLKLGVWILKMPLRSREEVGFLHRRRLLGSGPVLGMSPGKFLGTYSSGTSTLPA